MMPNVSRHPRIIKEIADSSLITCGFTKRAIISDPISTSRKDVQIKAVAEPRATHKTYRGFAPARSKVVI